MSLNETLSRTVMTSVTTMLALLAIVLFGGAVLRDFALAMMWGVLIGTYSSIFVAVGMLAFFDLKKDLDEDEDPGGPCARRAGARHGRGQDPRRQ